MPAAGWPGQPVALCFSSCVVRQPGHWLTSNRWHPPTMSSLPAWRKTSATFSNARRPAANQSNPGNKYAAPELRRRKDLMVTDQQINWEEVHDELKRGLLELMREVSGKGDHDQVKNWQQLGDLLPDREIPERHNEQMQALVCQIYHELYLDRIIVSGTGRTSADRMNWPFYRITDHGRRVLQTREYSPYDRHGYLRRLKSDIADLDETIVRYVAESLECLHRDCLLAAAVTIGCAAEKAVLLLIERFGKAISDPGKKKQYEKETDTWIVTRKYKAFRKKLQSVVKDLPQELSDPLEQRLHGTFDLIRRTRNDAGHPTGEPITREMVRASQIVFPDYCKYVYSLIEHFGVHGANL